MDFNEVADIRSLAEELARTEEKVRSSIANELRERILGFITMSRQRLDKFADSIELPEQLATIDMIRESIDISARRIESLARQICPTELYETSLESALCSLVEMVREEQNVPAVFKSDMTPIQVAEETRAIIFQVVRELLGNAARHAHAKRIVISLSLKKGNVVIKIEDNGIGFDADMIISANGKAGNFGILNARRRLEHIGGVVQVDTAPGCGTCITLLAPFKERIVESGGKRFANGCNAVQERPDSSRFDSVSVSYPAK